MTRLDLATEVVWIVGVVHQEFLRNVGEEAKVLVVCLRLSHPRHPLVLVVPPIMKAGGGGGTHTYTHTHAHAHAHTHTHMLV